MRIDFQTDPSRYRHWRLSVAGQVAELAMDVDPAASLFPGCELKLNSYDLGVDIELADAVQRLRFEHPEVRAVVLRSAKPGVFCAGANIRMLGRASHGHKVNFCKFTNETRLAIEDASAGSGQPWLCAVHASAAGGGYELALACAHILLVDDRRAAVSLPEVPLLGVLPATGGLTRLTDKRRVRRDRADLFCTTEEGVRGRRALDWRLVDELVAPSRWDAAVAARAAALAAGSDRPAEARGIALTPLDRRFEADSITYPHLRIALDRAGRRASLTLRGPDRLPADLAAIHAAGAAFWPLAAARELDDAILHLRTNEPELGLWLLRTEGDPAAVLEADRLLEAHAQDWLVREIRLYWKRVLKRLDVTSRSLIALIEPGSCFAGTLAEFAFAADRAVMRAGPGGGRQPAAGQPGAEPAELRPLPDGQRPHPPGHPLPGRARQPGQRPRRDRRAARRRGGRGPRPRHRRVRRHRLGRGTAPAAGRARELLPRRALRAGSQSPLRRAGDDGNPHLRPSVGLAELGLPAPRRGRRGRRAASLRQRHETGLRPRTGVIP